MIDPKLISLLRIVETGSYTKAAESLSLTQPAVSQHIRLLEEELGVKIFERQRNESRLTPAGKIVASYAKRMIALQNNMERALKNEQEQITSLTIGITHTAESNVIVEVLAAYVNLYEGVTLKILTDTTDRLYAMLDNAELDFAFVEGRAGDPSLHYMLLDTDSLVLAVAPGHAWADRSSISIEELKKEKLILRLPNSNTRNLFMASLESQNLSIEDFNVVMEIDSIATIKDLIRRGFGVSVLAKSACMDEWKKGKLVLLTIENFSMSREINIVYSEEFRHPEFLQGFIRKYNEMQN